MHVVSSHTIEESLDFPALIDILQQGFESDLLVPQRMHYDYAQPGSADTNMLLLMPAIRLGEFAGVKIINVASANSKAGLATIQGIYYLMDAVTGEPKAVFDAKSITNWRTAAASALASRYLSRANAHSLLMIGTGALAPYMIRAHAAVRPIDHLMIFGRSRQKAEALAAKFGKDFKRVDVVDAIDDRAGEADIISTATSSPGPLIHGEMLRPGQHVDLVGAFQPSTREADDEVMRRGRVFVDNLESVLLEAGDLIMPIESGVIHAEDIQGDLFQLSRGLATGRESEQDITVFKSVGHAMEDLVTAGFLYRRLFET